MPQETKPDRLGIGLSGGGLRASFFHIGVLAQMAELNLLRHVEVISTVSGGSIIGALYYLHIKELLERKSDGSITDQDYVEIVRKIESDFLKATEKNIRMATFSSFVANFRMMFLDYASSDRIAELYNEWLYQGVLQGAKRYSGTDIQGQTTVFSVNVEKFDSSKYSGSIKANCWVMSASMPAEKLTGQRREAKPQGGRVLLQARQRPMESRGCWGCRKQAEYSGTDHGFPHECYISLKRQHQFLAQRCGSFLELLQRGIVARVFQSFCGGP